MRIELTSEQRDLLVQLVDVAIGNISPEIRHTDSSTYKDDLKHQRGELRRLRDLLTAATPAEKGAPSSESTPPGLVGTP